ncbi:hypothetical protein AJ79_05318 [Helicocarpus griseus UAMH5409]|uniref:Uncharacterized protein n=1 Tax=Helicocarpus griseus UAMH5409 TaxID=1447875 RepID=A0A2B7XQF0_9EURO|nr:hypothetical protein AJ79_05318 [Helicocarpus griseus UAMH5409]
MTFDLPEGDLRRSATESKRVHDHNAKWALGFRPLPVEWMGPARKEPGTTRSRPARPESHHSKGSCKINRFQTQNLITKKNDANKSHFNYVVDQFINEEHNNSDSSADENVPEPCEAADDPNVFYSFDAPTGPSQGADILGVALARAVKKFETKETEKLAREYEFVAFEDPASHGGDGYTADDDDFEFINRTDL